jgi:PIN domain nuclease of toxin-antitoxin system
MKIVLDTHTLLWFIEGSSKLSIKARLKIEDLRNEIFVSSISLFEIAIKLKLGKLVLHKPLSEIFQDIKSAEIKVINISDLHLLEYQSIPFYTEHRDPFDRLIIATAIVERADIISMDQKFIYYKDLVKVIW